MTRDEIWQWIIDVGIVPVIRASSPELAVAAARAVCAGGIPIIEVTVTVPGAIAVIEAIARANGDSILIGAGTVLSAETAARCLDAGAQFLVSPGFDSETVKLANRQEIPVIAGALTPTEIINAWRAGADFVKVFPCSSAGGPAYIRELKTALPQIPMVPSGGFDTATAAEFFDAGASAVGIGRELISDSALQAGNLAAIAGAARQYVAIVRAAREAA